MLGNENAKCVINSETPQLLDRQTAVHLHGKGRKERVIPLWKNTATGLRAWLAKINDAPQEPVFPNRLGAPMSRPGVRDRLERAVAIAEHDCPSLRGQHISPHTLRHSYVISPALTG